MEYQPYNYLGRFFNQLSFIFIQLLINFSEGTHGSFRRPKEKIILSQLQSFTIVKVRGSSFL